MVKASIAEAKAGLSALLEKVSAGEEVVITRHGKPVARLLAVSPPKRRVGSLADFRKRMPPWSKPSSKLIRDMRDEER